MKLTLRGIVFSALFAALLVLFGYISIPLGFTPVPITLQTLAVMLAGALLGPLYGFLSVTLVIVLTALGFPLLHGVGGLQALLGPTGGYIFMWPFSALLIGLLLPRIKLSGLAGYASAFAVLLVFGSWLLYVSGVPWLAQATGITLEKAMIGGCYPYLLGDAIKAAAALVITIPLRQVFPAERLTGTAGGKVVTLD
ncbi:biotin transport system substrate-specific component [Paenibacillus sp. UNCCL117]|uniref:biotin transporter BioY n=1 Tax=unclassified Paenibacillus TaxID=185978 RepID=UPI00088E7198|nr:MULTISPECIES: biotin transporter BioY [unclassified Paenibacillus]SDC66597.1 biotin transport system substrate-specific component [Paenibacillus sp. cl123]SFW23088.1 biotin transport system substrate-specific component [Paenibacillus sp. UNCCL117]